MKISPMLSCIVSLFLGLAPYALGATVAKSDAQSHGRTITQVVKLLQQMMEKSKADGEAERLVYAKYKCYADTNTEEKNQLIADLTTSIGLLESGIESLQGENGALSSEVSQLQADIAANVQARSQADALRATAAANFATEESDLTAALDQITQAVNVLAAIGNDAAATNFMAGRTTVNTKLVKLHATVKQALVAASTFLSPSQRQKAGSFLQTLNAVPVAATYSTQSSEIVGILRQMKETFADNLQAARDTEAMAIRTHANLTTAKEGEHTLLTTSLSEKQATIGANAGDIATKSQQRDQAIQQKTDAEAFLATLSQMAATKASEYEERKLLRANEEAAIAQAIAILNSDAAFESFGKVAATSTGATSFVQFRTVHRHLARSNTSLLSATAAARALEREAAHSERVRRVLLLLQAGNPFDKVLAEIAKMKTLIDEEEQVDSQQLAWCTSETAANTASLGDKNIEIDGLNSEVTTLETTIDDPATGLKKQIADAEEDLEINLKNQKDSTAERNAEHATYQKTVADCVEAKALLERAVSVLTKYYDAMAAKIAEGGTALVQKQRKQTPPATWNTYEGQNTQGQSAIQMLNFIIGETVKEEDAAHTAENTAETAYNTTMATLQTEEGNLQTSIVTLKGTLADTELELETKRDALEVSTREKAALERYLAQIEPGCNFITTNYNMRSANRVAEKAALEQAMTLLKNTPAFASAVENADLESLGSCKSLCLGSNRTHVQCEACVADVSVPGYCAAHPGTTGC